MSKSVALQAAVEIDRIEQLKIDLPKIEHADAPMSDAEKLAWRFPRIESPSEWAVKKFSLPSKGYGEPGDLSFAGREWQRDIMDSFMHYHFTIVCGPVQVGKSISAVDVPWAWFQDVIGGRALLVYADKDTVEDVFEEKLKPIVEENLAHLWSRRDNDIRKDKIILSSGITRCASSNVQNDIATFAARFVCCDEVSKWRNKKFDAVGQAIGRTMDYWGAPGIDFRVSICSSPKETGDPLDKQMGQPGVYVFRYKMPCLGCGVFQELQLEQIEEIPEGDGPKDHDPERIRRQRAATYFCPHCGAEITDTDRYKMLARGRWETENGEYYMLDGMARDKNGDPADIDRVAFHFNRLVSRPEKYPFYECLASYFEARSSTDPNALQNFWNEHMARFWRPRTGTLTEELLKGRQNAEYTLRGPIPDGVIVAVAGIDTQDDGFFYMVVGYGRYMETWILRYGFIPCDMHLSEFKDPEKVHQRFAGQYYEALSTLVYKDTSRLSVLLGLMDEGGHRESDVQYICRRHMHDLMPYKGVEKDAPFVRKSKNKRLYLCNTQKFSGIVDTDLVSENFHLPAETEKGEHQELIDQLRRQYTKKEVDQNGRPKYVWVHGGNDHLRDCLNQARAAAYILDLPGRLNNDKGIEAIKNTVKRKSDNDPGWQPGKNESEKQESKENDEPRHIGRPARFNRVGITGRSPFSNRTRIWR